MSKILNKIESWIDKDVAAWLLVAGLVFMFSALFAYARWVGRDGALDFASVALPCSAGILAGLTSYFDKHKGIIYSASLLLLLAGVVCIMLKRDIPVLPLVFGVAGLAIFMLVTLVIIFFKRQGILGAGYDAHDTLIVIFEGLIIAYAAFFIMHNTSCLEKDVTFSSCKAIWFWW